MDVYYESSLCHHGIKGQKWGVRRYRNEDGSLTPAGKRRYRENDDGTYTRIKSDHRIRLEDKYREKGMSEQTAELAANRRIKTEKILATIGGLTLAAASAYLVTKVAKDKADFYIRKGSEVQVITNNAHKSFNKPFYAAVDKRDKTRYLGMLGSQHFRYNNVHKAILKPDSKIKVASRDKAAKVFAELYSKDPDFRAAFVRSNEAFKGRGSDIRQRAVNSVNSRMSKKTLLKEGYDAFNLGLVNHDRDGLSISHKFYKALEKRGYGAVVDINDQRMSGYNAKRPVIIFKASSTVLPKLRMSPAEINAAMDKTRRMDVRSEAVKRYAKRGAQYASLIGATTGAVSAYSTKQVNNYRNEHPNTKLSDREIYEMLR